MTILSLEDFMKKYNLKKNTMSKKWFSKSLWLFYKSHRFENVFW